jgi:hypothetical protein
MEYKLDTTKMTLNEKPIELGDLLLLLSKYDERHQDDIMDDIIMYWVLRYDGGWNGILLDHDFTTRLDPNLPIHGGSS